MMDALNRGIAALTRQLSVAQFRSDLCDYYDDLANWLSQAKGTKIQDVFEADAQRYAGTARGALALEWSSRYQENGADLAATWAGCMPEDDLSVLRAQKMEGGDQTLIVALRDLAHAHRVRAKVRSAAIGTVGLGLFAMLITAVSASLLPIWAVQVLSDAMRLPVEQWGKWGQRVAGWAVLVQAWWPWVAAVLLGIVALCVQSLSSWTGSGRDWADRHILLYRIYHQINAMRVAMTMGTLTRKSGSSILTLRRSIELVLSSTSSPYQAWQLQRLLDQIDGGTAAGAAVFDTGIFPQEMSWRLHDLNRGMSLADSFTKLIEAVEGIWLARLLRRMSVYRWILLLIALGVMAAVVFSIQLSVAEMKDVLMNAVNVS
jgi:type II secretory pathway component PulF